MSTGMNCSFFTTGEQWYYILQNWDCPVGAWDWREFATCYGPFAILSAAEEHLGAHHANPGGWTVEGHVVPDAVLAAKIVQARL